MNNSTATSTVALSKNLTSFFYQDLIVNVQAIQHKIIEIAKYLDTQWKNKTIRKELKSRSITFIDPYGNSITNEYMDHELIITLFRKYKKNYVPKYLQKWIKIGKMNENGISTLNDFELKSPVFKYSNGYQFIAYGVLNIFIEYREDIIPEPFLLRVLPTDTIEKIKIQLQSLRKLPKIELKLSILDQGSQTNKQSSNEDRTLESDDTVLSGQLYEENRIITAKILQEKTDTAESISYFMILVKLLTGRTIILYVNSDMTIASVKHLMQEKIDIPVNQQRLIFASKDLDNNKTLSEYKIEHLATLHMIQRLRGGMYHFTSGRLDFENLPPTGAAEAIKNVFAFNFKQLNNLELLSSTELQNLVLQGQVVLSQLFNVINEIFVFQGVPNIKNIILSNVNDDEHENNNEEEVDDDDDNVSNDQS
ncbi:unnamed protein product [Rotaria sp. Silwood1]|nr:unnamed protein product [Rotaria sp. Silwood1]CAF3718984.1 unnamed protein product [Rotaria sp. Silwood1]CAF3751991.1 unnamed protein product [Rotaria sp. Silwood1]CAF4749578.1 unnamed protein product [Rotaria sp. Silwood1]CAF4828864.1 unnamed protein product [Rotaria sp. Silwood1]